jgi:mannose-1-phosphate guanylyltransferase
MRGSVRSLYSNRAAIVLAGGDGTRLKSLTRKITGKDVPKQFCALMGNTTLLEETLKRAAFAVSPTLTLAVVNRAHERYYQPLLKGFPAELTVVQPGNRGTAPAILYALTRLADIAPDCTVTLFPSDHYVSDEAVFARYVVSAHEAVEERPELIILLGIAPDNPEPSYGWIEPGEDLGIECAEVSAVRRFFEKPNALLADQLWRTGSLWNSFVIVGRVSTLLAMFIIALPRLYVRFSAVREKLGTQCEQKTVELLYAGIADTNFSQDVLARSAVNLAVLPVRDVEWSDLGEPKRVIQALARSGVHPRWAAA